MVSAGQRSYMKLVTSKHGTNETPSISFAAASSTILSVHDCHGVSLGTDGCLSRGSERPSGQLSKRTCKLQSQVRRFIIHDCCFALNEIILAHRPRARPYTGTVASPLPAGTGSEPCSNCSTCGCSGTLKLKKRHKRHKHVKHDINLTTSEITRDTFHRRSWFICFRP